MHGTGVLRALIAISHTPIPLPDLQALITAVPMRKHLIRNQKKERDHIHRQGQLERSGVGTYGGDARTLSEIDHEKIDNQLKGNTLKVYMFLLRSQSGFVGIREVQRALKFSSPTLAQYHLEKLRELGLIRKQSTEYVLASDVKVGVLRQFYRLGTFLVPRFVLYAVLFTVLLGFLGLIVTEINLVAAFAFLLAISGAVIFWYEAVRALRERPKG
jgi:hypothetical protein